MENINDILNIDSIAHTKNYKKGDILQRHGETNPNAFFVKHGLLKSYSIDNKGKEHIFMFAPEGWVTADIESQVFNRPSELFIECIEDSEVILVPGNLLFGDDLSVEQLKKNKILTMRRIAVLQRRVIMLMSASALERYNAFLEAYPNLSQRLTQKMIASYLGVTPQALSTIRGKTARNK